MVDIQAIGKIIEELAAEIILPRFRRLEADDISEKGIRDVVTVVDEMMESSLADRLRSYLPGSNVLGEEDVYRNPDKMSLLRCRDPIWIIDPLDGTKNFVEGKHEFAVMVSLLRGSRPVAAWIHDPVGSTTAVAEAGAGARICEQRIQIGDLTPEGGVLRGSLQSGWNNLRTLRFPVSPQIEIEPSLHCAAHEYLRLLTKKRHFALFISLMPWDHVAGTFIYTQAGGVARSLDGPAYKPQDYSKAGIILAPNDEIWESLRSLVSDV
jgi:fructose-1,6-bisphosphatase/inositol monophosphatase family enzyme